MVVDTRDKVAAWREEVDRLPLEATLTRTLMDEVEYLTRLVTTVEAARMFDRFHAFDAIKDDQCPACRAAVVMDDSHAPRNRIISREYLARVGDHA